MPDSNTIDSFRIMLDSYRYMSGMLNGKCYLCASKGTRHARHLLKVPKFATKLPEHARLLNMAYFDIDWIVGMCSTNRNESAVTCYRVP